MITSSYVTNDCREWLTKILPSKRYRLHIVEGKALSLLLLGFPDLLLCYFDHYHRLLTDAVRTWNTLGILPSPEQLFHVSKHVDLAALSSAEHAFLYCVWRVRENEIDNWIIDNEPFTFANLQASLQTLAREGAPLLASAKTVRVVTEAVESMAFRVLLREGKAYMLDDGRKDHPPLGVRAELVLDFPTSARPALYTYHVLEDGTAMEVLVEGGRSLTSGIRRVATDVQSDQPKALAYLGWKQSDNNESADASRL